jgi:hypothetical protein
MKAAEAFFHCIKARRLQQAGVAESVRANSNISEGCARTSQYPSS